MPYARNVRSEDVFALLPHGTSSMKKVLVYLDDDIYIKERCHDRYLIIKGIHFNSIRRRLSVAPCGLCSIWR